MLFYWPYSCVQPDKSFFKILHDTSCLGPRVQKWVRYRFPLGGRGPRAVIKQASAKSQLNI